MSGHCRPARRAVGGLRPPRLQVRLVDPVAADGTRARPGGLEPHRDHTAPRAPHPAAAHRDVLDVHPGRPGVRGGLRPVRGRSPGVQVGVLGLLVVLGRAEEVFLDPVGQPGDAHAEQPDATRGVEVLEQADREPPDRRGRVGGGADRGRAADGREVVQPHLDRDRAAGQAAGPQALGDLARLAGQQGRHQLPVGEIGVVGALDADRLGLPLGHHGPVVLGPREPVQAVPLGGAEQADELVLADGLEVGHGVDAGAAKALGRRRADARDDRDVHRPQQVRLATGRDDDQAVGLVEVAGHLGDELRRPDPDRRGQPSGHLGHLAPQPLGHRRDRRELEVGQPGRGEVHERLVQRQRLDQRRGRAQDGHHLLAGGPVRVEPAAQERRVRAP